MEELVWSEEEDGRAPSPAARTRMIRKLWTEVRGTVLKAIWDGRCALFHESIAPGGDPGPGVEEPQIAPIPACPLQTASPPPLAIFFCQQLPFYKNKVTTATR